MDLWSTVKKTRLSITIGDKNKAEITIQQRHSISNEKMTIEKSMQGRTTVAMGNHILSFMTFN